jgi:hypothetical protein
VTPKSPKIGLWMAQFAAVGMMAGGAFDLSLRSALPHHADALGIPLADIPAATEALVLLILRALGLTLLVVGALSLVLLHLAVRHRVRGAAWAAAAGITVASGWNAWSIFQVDSLFFVGPLVLPLLAVGGVLLLNPSLGETSVP